MKVEIKMNIEQKLDQLTEVLNTYVRLTDDLVSGISTLREEILRTAGNEHTDIDENSKKTIIFKIGSAKYVVSKYIDIVATVVNFFGVKQIYENNIGGTGNSAINTVVRINDAIANRTSPSGVKYYTKPIDSEYVLFTNMSANGCRRRARAICDYFKVPFEMISE